MHEDYYHDEGDANDNDNNGAQVRPASPDEGQAASDESFCCLQVSRFVPTTSLNPLPQPFVLTVELKSMPSLSIASEPPPLAPSSLQNSNQCHPCTSRSVDPSLTPQSFHKSPCLCQKSKSVFCSDPFLSLHFLSRPPDSPRQLHFSGEIDPSILSKCDLCFTEPCQNGASCRSLPNRDFECRSVGTFYKLEAFYKPTHSSTVYDGSIFL